MTKARIAWMLMVAPTDLHRYISGTTPPPDAVLERIPALLAELKARTERAEAVWVAIMVKTRPRSPRRGPLSGLSSVKSAGAVS